MRDSLFALRPGLSRSPSFHLDLETCLLVEPVVVGDPWHVSMNRNEVKVPQDLQYELVHLTERDLEESQLP